MYNKLFARIVDSSVWLQSDQTLRVWIMFIAVMDQDGLVGLAAIGNVAQRARVSLKDAAEAVRVLESPDPESSDPEFEGRRIERIPGGWMVLNSQKYRAQVTYENIKAKTRERVARFRERLKANRKAEQARLDIVGGGGNEIADAEPLNNEHQTVLEYWRSKMPDRANARATPNRITKIKERLKEYPVEMLLQAIDGCAASKFNMGENDRETAYNDLTLILRNGEKVEAFAAMAPRMKKKHETITEAALRALEESGMILGMVK